MTIESLWYDIFKENHVGKYDDWKGCAQNLEKARKSKQKRRSHVRY